MTPQEAKDKRAELLRRYDAGELTQEQYTAESDKVAEALAKASQDSGAKEGQARATHQTKVDAAIERLEGVITELAARAYGKEKAEKQHFKQPIENFITARLSAKANEIAQREGVDVKQGMGIALLQMDDAFIKDVTAATEKEFDISDEPADDADKDKDAKAAKAAAKVKAEHDEDADDVKNAPREAGDGTDADGTGKDGDANAEKRLMEIMDDPSSDKFKVTTVAEMVAIADDLAKQEGIPTSVFTENADGSMTATR